MSTFSWKVGKPEDSPDHLPACSSCRKRKLRCSRSGPPCTHCDRLATKCEYDAKQKPGLKPGALETLSRRVAFLEKILLDENDRPLVSFDKHGSIFGQNYEPDTGKDNAVSTTVENSSNIPILSSTIERPYTEAPISEVEDPVSVPVVHSLNPSQQSTSGLDGNHSDTTNEDSPPSSYLEQTLPSVEILTAVVQYFCISFHHWIPFLHKARWTRQVGEGPLDSGDLLVLHAAVSVVLPRIAIDNDIVGTADAEIQANTSRALVTRYAMSDMSLKNLMALVILIFQDLNDGRLCRSYGLVGYLTKTIDFLQLGIEQDASRSKALMKPLKSLTPTTDWTELESRRRLFWCVFLIDRFTSATTGLNTSFTAEDVGRRLPSDGFYFTSEKPVSCPFFGLWNKKYAKLDVSLTAHIPAQYNEGDRHVDNTIARSPSTVASVSSGVDASRLGAFAYCVEATESLNQITTFFLQQCIDWQDRQDVVNWLTRFKELDLRLVHWKQLLPSRWKDSNISVDKSLVDMDPNLTLAHMTHNTSMILLHYSIACPPPEWSSLIKLPSSCSIETCHLAATEISQIAGKFLQHTRIPFVNSQFSFCVLVAAKVLLALSQVTNHPLDQQFDLMIEALWLISARWENQQNNDKYRATCRAQNDCDLAAEYAQFLEKLRDKCDESEEYRFDLLDHSCSNLGHAPPTPLNNITGAVHAYISNSGEQSLHRHKRASYGSNKAQGSKKRPRYSIRSPRTRAQNQEQSPGAPVESPEILYPANSTQLERSAMPPPGFRENTARFDGGHSMIPQNGSHDSASMRSTTPSTQVPYNHIPDWVAQAQMWYAGDGTSDVLMGPDFTDLDRVITFEDATFHAFDFSSV